MNGRGELPIVRPRREGRVQDIKTATVGRQVDRGDRLAREVHDRPGVLQAKMLDRGDIPIARRHPHRHVRRGRRLLCPRRHHQGVVGKRSTAGLVEIPETGPKPIDRPSAEAVIGMSPSLVIGESPNTVQTRAGKRRACRQYSGGWSSVERLW